MRHRRTYFCNDQGMKNTAHIQRRQLTLFLEKGDSEVIEQIRRTFNPEQYALIKSHVTLCREDELDPVETVKRNLERLRFAPLTIDFGPAVRFADGKGVLLPALGANETFHKLRRAILQGLVEQPRKHEPHITLMHPRNSTCTDELFAEIKKYALPHKITFRKISLIEQEMGKPWKILEEFDLKDEACFK